MAKKKTASKVKPTGTTVKPAKSVSSAPKKVAKSAAALNVDEIGHVAGQVWQALSEGSDHSAASLKKSVNAPGDLVMAAIGWLAREEKLEFDSTGRAVKISLK